MARGLPLATLDVEDFVDQRVARRLGPGKDARAPGKLTCWSAGLRRVRGRSANDRSKARTAVPDAGARSRRPRLTEKTLARVGGEMSVTA